MKQPSKGNRSPRSTPERLVDPIHVDRDNLQDLPDSDCANTPAVPVRLQAQDRCAAERSEHVQLNTAIRYQMKSTGFDAYRTYIDKLMGRLDRGGELEAAGMQALGAFAASAAVERKEKGAEAPMIKLHGTLAYEVLRLATEAFLLTRCGPTCVDFGDKADLEDTIGDDAGRLMLNESRYHAKVMAYLKQMGSSEAATPYLDKIVEQLELVPPSPTDKLARLYASRYECPAMIELIWSYWHEEGMQSQAMNAIGIRFQNRRARPGADPLVNLETDPLRPLNNLLWGWIQTEYRRLTVPRRAYEYDHHYGLTLLGKAVPPLLSADSRSKFLESFHTLLAVAHRYYDDASNTTIIPDGFPLLNALRGTHLILAEGAHNQYGDLPWTARVEMLIEQWLLARPEMREFLRSRPMVPYHEPWMGQVDAMKKLQGWTDVSITHYHELATCGEGILLSVRHGPWATSNDQADAKVWADYWRPEVQRYLYAYKAVTGVDLTLDPPDNTVPARLISDRLTQQRQQVGYAR